MHKLIYSIFFLSLFACAGNVELSSLSLKIDENEKKWSSSAPPNYSFTYSRYPIDCPQADAMPPVVITVNSGTIVSVYNPEFNRFLSNLESWPSIDQLFEEVAALSIGAQKSFSKSEVELDSDPEFDSAYGFPISYYVDKSDAKCDAFLVTISEFK